jgi:hypothetical protein
LIRLYCFRLETCSFLFFVYCKKINKFIKWFFHIQIIAFHSEINQYKSLNFYFLDIVLYCHLCRFVNYFIRLFQNLASSMYEKMGPDNWWIRCTRSQKWQCTAIITRVICC